MVLRKLRMIPVNLLLTFFLILILNRVFMLFYGAGSYELNKLAIVACSLCFLVYMLIDVRNFRVSRRVMVMLLFSGLLVFVTVLQILVHPNDYDVHGRSSHAYLIGNTAYAVFYICVGFIIIKKDWIKSNLIMGLLLSVLLLLVLDVSEANGFIDYRKLSENLTSQGGAAANHLVLGPFFYILFIYSYSFSKGFGRPIGFVVIFYMLFVLGGRGDLILFFMSVLTFEIIKDFSLKKLSVSLVAGAVSASGCLVVLKVLPNSGFFERMMLKGGLESDGSFVERVEQFKIGLEALLGQLLVGDIGFIVKSQGNLGSYVHNFISIWQFYGVFIMFLVFCFFYYGFMALQHPKKISFFDFGRNKYDFFSLLLLTSFYGILFFKSANYILLWVMIGCVLGLEPIIRRANNIKEYNRVSEDLYMLKTSHQ